MPRSPTNAHQTADRSSAVEKALRIIEAVVRASSPITMGAIERATGLPRPTAHRVTNGLIEAGYIEREPRQRGHGPGPRLMAVAHQLLLNGSPRSRRLDVLDGLSRETGEGSHFALLRGAVVHLLDHVQSPVPLGVSYDGHDRLPIHGPACGRVMLAHLPQAQRDTTIGAATLTRLTERTITDRRRLSASLADIREAGLCIEEGEHIDGVVTMAVPVLSKGGLLIGALGIALPQVRHTPAHSRRCATALRGAATQMAAIFD